METGYELLARARLLSDEDLSELIGQSADGLVLRAALMATLLETREPGDVRLLRSAVREEISFRRLANDGCGEVLYAGCWMLFVEGHLEDAGLIWTAKELNFDTHCYIDGVFLVPHGLDAAVEAAGDNDELVSWLTDGESFTEEDIVAAKTSSYFSQGPGPSASVEELARRLNP